MSILENFKTFFKKLFLRDQKKEEKLLSLEEARREAAKAVDKGMDFTEELRHRFGGAFFKKMEEAEKE